MGGFGWILLIIVILAVIILVSVISVYNKLVRLIEAVKNNERQIDIQLDRRFKVFESLINVVKNVMNFEKTTLTDVVRLRNQAQQAHKDGDENKRMALENQISGIASGINVVFENYPELKSTANAQQLQEEISNTENKLSFAKQAFNDSIEVYNSTKKSFFESFIVNIFSNLNKDFTYWQLSDDKIAEHESYTVSLDDDKK